MTSNTYDNEEDIDWGEDTSEEAQQRRMKELSSAVANLAVTADLEKTPQERADLFFEFVKVRINSTMFHPNNLSNKSHWTIIRIHAPCMLSLCLRLIN